MSMTMHDFLRRPLPAIDAPSVDNALRWIAGGAILLAPRWLRRRGWRRIRRLVYGDRLFVIERSWLGENRLAALEGDEARAPAAFDIALPAESVFETSIDLPAAAARNLQQAIGFRLDELSPLPASEVAFVPGSSPQIREGRVTARLAIARRRDIDEILERYEGLPLQRIGAGLLPDGRFDFVFHRAAGGHRHTFVRFLAAASALVGGFLLLGAGSLHQVSERLDRKTEIEARLLAEIRQERAFGAPFLNLPDHVSPAISNAAIRISFSKILDVTPEMSALQNAIIEPGAISLIGFTPEGEPLPEGAALMNDQPARPGFQTWFLAVETEPAP